MTDTAQATRTDYVKCGHVINTEKGSKPCVKPQGHQTDPALLEEWGKGHATRIQKRIEYKPLKASILKTLTDVPDDEEVEYGGGKTAAERDEFQRGVDDIWKENYQAWVRAGKPKRFNPDPTGKEKHMPRKRFFIAPDEEAAMRAALRSAARFHGGAVRIAPIKKHQSGKSMLYWAACDVSPHATNGSTAS